MPALAELNDLKAYLGVTSNNADTELTRLLNAASATAEQFCERVLSFGPRTERRHGNGGSLLMLRDAPVTAITTLSIDGSPIPASDGQSAGYLFDAGPELYLIGYRFCRGTLNVAVTYQAGHQQIPADLAHAVIEIAAQAYKEKDWIGFQSKSIGGETVSFLRSGVPDSAKFTLERGGYQRRYGLT